MNDYLPVDRQEVGNEPNMDNLDEVIALADECGLIFQGLDEDNEPIFLGEAKQFDELEEKLLLN